MQASWQLKRTAVKLGTELNRGNFGVVYRGGYDGTEVAVKQPKGPITTAQLQEAQKEAALMKGIPAHPNVLIFYGACTDQQGILIVTELCEGGSLDGYLLANPKLDGSTRLALALQVARGMAHLHSLQPPVLHRDLAARNVLVAVTTKGLVAKVADFGMARALATAIYEVHGNVPVRWTAPEVLRTRTHYAGSDVWSYGVTVWEIYSKGGLTPYADLETTEEVVDLVCEQREVLGKPTVCPSSVWAQVSKCFAYEHTQRPTFAALVQALASM